MTAFVENRRYTLEDFAPYIRPSGGRNPLLLDLPNARNVDPLEFLNDIAAHGHMLQAIWGYTLIGGRPQWTQLFLQVDDGSGMAVTYGGSKQNAPGVWKATPITRRFAICKHEKQMHPGANPQRGWHPGHCKLCGLNMTYDSGD